MDNPTLLLLLSGILIGSGGLLALLTLLFLYFVSKK
jgi:hypothetical protein